MSSLCVGIEIIVFAAGGPVGFRVWCQMDPIITWFPNNDIGLQDMERGRKRGYSSFLCRVDELPDLMAKTSNRGPFPLPGCFLHKEGPVTLTDAINV